MPKNDWTKDRDICESINTKTNKTKLTQRQRKTTGTPGGYKFAPRLVKHLYRAMLSEPARTRLVWANLLFVLPVTFGHTSACLSQAFNSFAAIRFTLKRPAPCSAVLRHSTLSWGAVVHCSALMPKALRSSKKHPVRYFPWSSK